MVEHVSNFFTDSYDMIAADSQRIEMKIFDCLDKNEYDKLNELLQQLASYKSMIDLYLEENEDVINQGRNLSIYYAGYITALLQLSDRFIRRQWKEEQLQNIRPKYFEEILKLLLEKPYLSHEELAAQLGVSSSSLNHIISEIESCAVNVINKEGNSKYTIYSLNPHGKQYAQKLFAKLETEHELMKG